MRGGRGAHKETPLMLPLPPHCWKKKVGFNSTWRSPSYTHRHTRTGTHTQTHSAEHLFYCLLTSRPFGVTSPLFHGCGLSQTNTLPSKHVPQIYQRKVCKASHIKYAHPKSSFSYLKWFCRVSYIYLLNLVNKAHHPHLYWIQQSFWEKTSQTNVLPENRHTDAWLEDSKWILSEKHNLSDLSNYVFPPLWNYRQQLQTDTFSQTWKQKPKALTQCWL